MISAKRREGERRAAPMTLRHLQIFKTVCEKKSVTAGAEALGMTQPAVSIAVRELEGFYGVRLFDRIGRKIYLTGPGRRLQADAEAILSRANKEILSAHLKHCVREAASEEERSQKIDEFVTTLGHILK